MTTPTLIIGAGIAGLWAALKLAPQPVTLLTGSPLGTGAASGWAQGGVAAALATDDTPALHARDTMLAGAGLVEPEAALALAEGAAEEVKALASLGAPLEREGDQWGLSREAAHSRHRVARVRGDGAGAAIMETLITAVRAAKHIDLRDGWSATGLLGDTACTGVIAVDPESAQHTLHADNTILAMGGAGGLFALTTTPAGAQGQAMAMAARLGATIQDPEFIQFHPTALNADLDPAPLCTEALRGEGATLIDRTGHRFMKAIHEDAELAPRDVVARAVHRQNLSGKHAFLHCREAIGDAFPDDFPAVFQACMDADIDPRFEPIPVAPTAHYHMGGVKTGIDGQTDVPGLWAIGECASTGLHGANRLASNSLAEGLVSGARVAKAILLPPPAGEVGGACRSKGAERSEVSPSTTSCPPSPASGGGKVLPHLALQRLRLAMSRHCGVERTQSGLESLRDLINQLAEKHGDCDPLLAARFIVTAALRRTESRGGHFRSDHPISADTARHTQMKLTDLTRRQPVAQPQYWPAE